MATAQQFEDLHVWQDARALVNSIYIASKQRDFYRDQEYLNQARFNELKESAVTLSRRIATFMAYLQKYPDNSRIRKPTKR